MNTDQTRRTFLMTSGTVLIGIGTTAAQPVTAWTEGAPTLTGRTQPTIGTNPDAPTAFVYGSFSCPYTEEFIKDGNLEQIVTEYVEPGYLNLAFRPLEYDPDDSDSYWISSNGAQAGQAAYGVWEEDPGSFWDFFARTWQEMPGWTNSSRLEEYMNDTSVANASEIASNLEAYDSDLKATAHAGSNAGIIYTPQMELNGDLTGPRNDWVFDFLDARIDTESPFNVFTGQASNIEGNSTTLAAELEGLGGASEASMWVRYWDPAGNYADTNWLTVSEPGRYMFEVDGLKPDTEYEYRVRAYNGEHIGGENRIFTTQEEGFYVLTGQASNIGGNSTTLAAELEGLGGASKASVWVRYWDSAGNYADTERLTVSEAGKYTFEVDGLDPNTEYEHRARAYNGEHIGGEFLTFAI